MQFGIVVLPGDGVGPEVTEQAVRVLREVANIYGHSFHFEEHPVGGTAIRLSGSPLPANTIAACKRAHAVLLGAIGSPEFDHLPGPEKPEAGLLQLRRDCRSCCCVDAAEASGCNSIGAGLGRTGVG